MAIDYSIGITTYSYRFEKYLVPLLDAIRLYRSNTIILGINGNHKEDFDEDYRKKVLQLASEKKGVFPFIYPNFRSLAKIWNNIIINASHEYILILNDDTSVLSLFFDTVEKAIEEHKTSFRMDSMFCYFVAKKSEINQLGWFDERFLGIGWEDTEFMERYKRSLDRDLLNITFVPGIKTHICSENCLINQRKACGKYTAFNEEVYHKIHHKELPSTSPQYFHEVFYRENINKL